MSDALRYARLHGPTTGDRVRLADTGLVIRVESDAQRSGEEFVTGYGKTARDGMHLQAEPTPATCDVIVSNVVLIDPLLGVRKASIGIRDGRVHAVGRAGNPDTLDGVDVVAGTGTTVIAGEGLIATPGVVDTHVHLVSPRIMNAALAAGVTTVVSQNFGPTWGCGVTSPVESRHAFRAFDAWPVNIAILARGSTSHPGTLVRALAEGGASGFKVHEDMGAHARALDTALTVADEHDVQVALHSDTLNEALFVQDTLAVAGGRTLHAFHVEGCGGGHAPDVLRLAGVPNIIGSSTNPGLPFTRDTMDEHLHMIATVHRLDPGDPGALRLAHDRIRAGTLGAEDVLHDLGVIPITSSDSQAMGRIGETVRRTFAVAAKMKAGDAEPGGDDNERVLRYIAKLTINPALAHGMAHEIGALTPGRLADIVLWDPRYFGAKPQLVLKAGYPAYGVTGDPNASTETSEPLVLGPQFGAYGETAADLSVAFVSRAAHDGGDGIPTRRRRVAVRGTRAVGLADMIRNDRRGSVRVDAATGAVTLDGSPISSVPAERTPLSQLYFL
ncbi:urease subunit alpha [Streptosporangium becharense]|uniref:Urease subunit alpha n=1 Tax=Streptosporangium becharense TaxID=1816182 RepID=A0A7W9IAS6_9ACTN|nr:urease subunit alpha [Streptosporangium becharense]MBB2910611.1 urease subunit alpha [Streptosporangium becharense]MBB5817307.1 urease subunit alpha [Streptosporangium becharense]